MTDEGDRRSGNKPQAANGRPYVVPKRIMGLAWLAFSLRKMEAI